MAQSKMSTNWRMPSKADLKKCEFNFSQFVIRVLNEDEKREALQLIKKALSGSGDDHCTIALKFNAVSMKPLLECLIEPHLDQNIIFGCFLKENDIFSVFKQGKKWEQEKSLIKIKLVAVDFLYVRNINDTFPEPSKDSGEAFVNLMKYMKRIEREVWSIGVQKICNILISFGVFASEEFKNDKRIPKEMIKNRKKVAHELWIKVLGAAFIGKETEQAKKEANTYEVVRIFQSEDSKELGLDNISAKDFKTIFPIVIMGAKQKLKTESDAEIRDKARRKKPKLENKDN